MAQEMCRHKGCTCNARSDGFCSEYCASEGDSVGHAGQACSCAHDECTAPTKFESKAEYADLAPEGRFVKDAAPRDW